MSSADSPSPGRPGLIVFICLLLAGLTVGALYTVVGNGFITDQDDDMYVVNNAHVRTGLTAENVRWAWTAFHAFNWHPLTWMSLQADSQFFGTSPAGYHRTNLVLHTLDTVLWFLVLYYLTGALWPSALVAALFGVHPLHVESVAWTAERKDVLSTLFWLLTLSAYGWYARRPGWGRYALVVLVFAVGLTAKPMLVTLPCVLLLLDYWPLGRWATVRWGWLVAEKIPLLLLTVGVCFLTLRAQEHIVKELAEFPLEVRIRNALVTYANYLGQMVWPAKLSFFYPHPGSALPGWKVTRAIVVLVAISALVVAAYRRRPYLAVGWLWYLGTLVPVVGFVQVGFQGQADRYTYIPLVGIFLMIAWGLRDLVARWPWLVWLAAPAVSCVLGLLAVATSVQVGYWKSNTTLWEHTVETTPENYKAWNVLGANLLVEGKVEQARHYFLQSLKVNPNYSRAHLNLGVVYSRENDLAGAKAEYQEALRLMPDFPEALNDMGLLLSRQEKFDEALTYFRRALDVSPKYVEAKLNYGSTLVRQGRLEEAVTWFRAVADAYPGNVQSRLVLGPVLLRLGRPEEAGRDLEHLLANYPEVPEAHNQLGRVYRRLGKLDEATTHFRQAVALDRGNITAHCNLAQALYETGHRPEAAQEFDQAAMISPTWRDDADRGARAMLTEKAGVGRDPPHALEIALQVCQADEFREPRHLETLALAYAETGAMARAAETVRRAIELAGKENPGSVPALREQLRRYESGGTN